MYNSQIQLSTGISKSMFSNSIGEFAIPKTNQLEGVDKPQFKDFLTEV